MEAESKKIIVSFRLLGSRILHTWLKKNPNSEETEEILLVRKKYLKKYGLENNKFVEMIYLPKGRKSLKKLTLFLKRMENEYIINENQINLIPYNASFFYRILRNSLSSISKSQSLPYIYSKFIDGEREALKTLYSNGVFSLYGEEKRLGEELVESENSREQIIFLNDSLLYIEYRGVVIKQMLISLAARTEEVILDSAIETDRASLIINIQEMLFPNIEELRDFLDTITTIQQNYPFNHHIFISRDRKWNSFFEECYTLYPATLSIVKNFSAAIELAQFVERNGKIRQMESIEENLSISIKQLRKNQIELNQFLNDIYENSSHIDDNIASISPGNILKQLFYSFSITFYNLLNKIKKLEQEKKAALEQVDKHRLLYNLHLEFESATNQDELLLSIIHKVGPTSPADRIVIYKEQLNGDLIISECWEGNYIDSIDGLIVPKDIKDSFFASERHQYLSDYHFSNNDSNWRLKVLPKLSSIRSHIAIKGAVSKELSGYKSNQKVIISFQICNKRNYTKPILDMLSELIDESDRLLTMINLDKVIKTGIENENTEIELPIDKRTAIEEFDGDEDFLIDVIRQFLEALVLQLELIEDGIEKEDYESIHQESHKIKGGSGNLFAYPLQQAATELDEAAKREDSNNINYYLDNVKKEANKLARYLHISATSF